MRVFARRDLHWKAFDLHVGMRKRPLATIVVDEQWPDMYRVRLPDGQLTDMVNMTRAKDAAIAAALRHLNTQETTPAAGAGALKRAAATEPAG